MKEWHKEIDPKRIHISAIYPNGEPPDDINVFIEDLWNKALKIGKSRWKLTTDDFRDFLKNFEEIKDGIEKDLQYFKCDIERYFDKIDKEVL